MHRICISMGDLLYYSQLFCSDAKLANLKGNLRIIRLHLHENRVKREVNLPNVIVHFWRASFKSNLKPINIIVIAHKVETNDPH